VPTPAERSLRVFPAGSNGEFNLPPELAIVIERGEGSRLWDTAGREFLDFSLGWGSVLVGHARPEVVAAVARQAALGSNFSYVTTASLALAEELLRLSPACRAVRFCASGTEATMYCQRLARAFTGRRKILRFEGAYHGANEIGVTSLFPSGPADYPRPQATSAGLVDREQLVAPFNDLEATAAIVEQHARELAGIIVEPLQRCVPPRPGFLEGLGELTRRHGALLVFDEVVTGFRLAYGGAQQYYGVAPDLVAYGKALGGGYPIGAFGGRREVMDLVREDRLGRTDYVWTASTLGGNPVSCSAALAALGVLREPGTYERLHALGRYLRAGLARVLAEAGLAAVVLGDGPLAQFVLGTGEVYDYRTSQHADKALARRIALELFARGVFLNPMGTKLYLSLAHTEKDCDVFFERFGQALDAARSASPSAARR
jgi:glutamate-1-semialdehyde 2,1-aminomutase